MAVAEILGMNAIAFGMGAANTVLSAANLGVGIANYNQCKGIKNDTRYIRENMLLEDTAKDMFKSTQKAICNSTDKLGAQIGYAAMGIPTQEQHGRLVECDTRKMRNRLADDDEEKLLLTEQNRALRKMLIEQETRSSYPQQAQQQAYYGMPTQAPQYVPPVQPVPTMPSVATPTVAPVQQPLISDAQLQTFAASIIDGISQNLSATGVTK